MELAKNARDASGNTALTASYLLLQQLSFQLQVSGSIIDHAASSIAVPVDLAI